jgi:hypothetical protein
MADRQHALTPSAIWAQRNDRIYLTIQVEDCKNPQIVLEEDKIRFTGKGGAQQAEYDLTIELYDKINPSESKYTVLPRNIPMILIRKESGPYWPRLFKEKMKVYLEFVVFSCVVPFIFCLYIFILSTSSVGLSQFLKCLICCYFISNLDR